LLLRSALIKDCALRIMPAGVCGEFVAHTNWHTLLNGKRYSSVIF